jgi:hydrogenase maturation protease
LAKTVILGIGQSLRGDDGAGLAAVRRWQALYPVRASYPNLSVVLLELPGLALLDYLAGAQQALLVDAVHSGIPPGSVKLVNEADLVEFGPGSESAHGWGVAETLALGRRLQPEKMPARSYILGIEAGEVNLGDQLSSQVDAALDHAAALIAAWLDESLPDHFLP